MLLSVHTQVVLDDGTVVKPHEVCGEAVPTSKCLVVDCPSEHFLQSLVESEAIRRELGEFPVVPYVFHFTPRKVPQQSPWSQTLVC